MSHENINPQNQQPTEAWGGSPGSWRDEVIEPQTVNEAMQADPLANQGPTEILPPAVDRIPENQAGGVPISTPTEVPFDNRTELQKIMDDRGLTRQVFGMTSTQQLPHKRGEPASKVMGSPGSPRL